MSTTYYAVISDAPDDNGTTFADYGDDSFVSLLATDRAAHLLATLTAAGITAGLYINGWFKAGTDVLAEVVQVHAPVRPRPVFESDADIADYYRVWGDDSLV